MTRTGVSSTSAGASCLYGHVAKLWCAAYLTVPLLLWPKICLIGLLLEEGLL